MAGIDLITDRYPNKTISHVHENKNAGDGLFAIAKEGCPKGEETATIRVWVR
ncbi:MAG: hypothetical protein ABH851_08950 [Methanobacteriota archaeon]